MLSNRNEGVQLQREYYTETAHVYENMHQHEGSGDPVGNKFVQSILRMVEARSVLDVGTATGRSLSELRVAMPDGYLCAIEPVKALLDNAAVRASETRAFLVQGDGAALPFGDKSFDAVCEFSVLHHVPAPNIVVREMIRVAKRAVLISDSNRFGQGSLAARWIKLGLHKSGLWSSYNRLRTFGKGYRVTEGDGISYSYSIYDSLDLLSDWADHLILCSDAGSGSKCTFHPLLTSQAILVCALKLNS
ncbi:MAG TPA: class I SAM-dependent methyltransferase [Candidatus Acidoferrum sp.]|nr:class I SAM-dependent methyltransferase [Candidatus Acidoferrum sp.]